VALKRRLAGTAALACLATLVLPATAMADTVVPAGRTVVEITVIGEDVVLDGTSAGSVIVVDGDVTIGPHGRAMDGVTLIGGRLTTAPGSRIRGDVFQFGGPIPHPSGWTLVGMLAALLAARTAVVWLIVRIARILEPWPTAAAMLAASRRRPIRSGVVGALLAAGGLAAGVLLALVVVGLIFAAALAGVVLLATSLGVSFALAGVRHDPRHATTIALALALPLIGDALLALACIVGLGAAFHYVVDERDGRTMPIPSES
jgi:hypothetical protein